MDSMKKLLALVVISMASSALLGGCTVEEVWEVSVEEASFLESDTMTRTCVEIQARDDIDVDCGFEAPFKISIGKDRIEDSSIVMYVEQDRVLAIDLTVNDSLEFSASEDGRSLRATMEEAEGSATH